MLLVKRAIYIGFCSYRRSYLIWSPRNRENTGIPGINIPGMCFMYMKRPDHYKVPRDTDLSSSVEKLRQSETCVCPQYHVLP